jgi:RNA-binding signal recognition particle 68
VPTFGWGGAGRSEERFTVKMDPVMEPDTSAQAFPLPILQTIKAAQAQYGLRHGDYTRYRLCRFCGPALKLGGTCFCSPFFCKICRLYCTRRLRRLFVALNFTHGKGRFQKRQVQAAIITDARCEGLARVFPSSPFGYLFLRDKLFHFAADTFTSFS